ARGAGDQCGLAGRSVRGHGRILLLDFFVAISVRPAPPRLHRWELDRRNRPPQLETQSGGGPVRAPQIELHPAENSRMRAEPVHQTGMDVDVGELDAREARQKRRGEQGVERGVVGGSELGESELAKRRKTGALEKR